MLYFDNAATTKISKNALDAYNKASEQFFNPSALYGVAANVMNGIEQARDFFIKKLKGKPKSSFIFTGSATESNNAVLKSCITRKDKKYLISAGEHSSVYTTAKKLKEEGFNIKFIDLNQDGTLNLAALQAELDGDVAFISAIHVSNETGAINDIKKIVEIAKAKNNNILVHADGVQAIGKLDIDLKSLGVDFYTISAHKINGPKGVGGLYIANPNKFKPLLTGGAQEMDLRAGTENTAGIAAFKTAMNDLVIHNYKAHKQALISNISVNDYILASGDNCVDNIVTFCFAGVRGETIVHMLEAKGFLVGTGSACNSKAGVNRVLSGIVPKKYIEGVVRISFGQDITVKDCEHLAKELSNAVRDYRTKIKKV